MFIRTSAAVVTGILSFTAGMVFGVLFAPASGEKTRRRLRRTGEEIADKAAEVKESAEDLVERTRRRIA
jgi:gas vesicle protein